VDYVDANEAGYAAILGLEQLAATAPAEEAELWARLTIDAQIEFALLFSADRRAAAVQGAAADSLFALGEHEQAVELAENMRSTWPDLPLSLEKPALLILGHGRFELEEFVAAEAAYRELLEMPIEAAERTIVEERLLAAIYRQGEAAEEAGDVDAAVAHYLRLNEAVPGAALAGQGQYDAVAVLETAGRLDEAAALLADFRSRHPDHDLARDVEKRLAGLYEQTGDRAGAAAEYALLADSSTSPEVRRQSRYRAAELYLEIDDSQRAAAQFERYVDEFAEPLDARLEAVHRLDQLAAARGDQVERRRWLEAKIDVYRRHGRNAPERATYLAAEAQYALAEEERVSFDVIALEAPLPKSLKRKQRSLARTVRAFEAAADYGVMDFATAATFQIADLYTALSRSILESERPPELSALELEQYEILLEEQAFPFEEQAIALHEINMRRSWEGVWDEWIRKSFAELGRLMPARFDKQEADLAYVEAIH
jgi:hypothetical protein